MNREQFFAKLTSLDENQLKQALWNVYWRGTAPVRERIEVELEPSTSERRTRARPEPMDPAQVLEEARQFVSLARAGAYMAGDRRVTPKERTHWRSTFKRLLANTRETLRADDITAGVAATETLIDLACELRSYDYFHSDDPIEAARVVVSDEVALLWRHVLDRAGFGPFAEQAAAQLIRWESRYGWTRRGEGRVCARETSLANVLAGTLQVPDAWTTLADSYLDALDQAAATGSCARVPWRSADFEREQRAADLAEWHQLLLRALIDDDADDRLDRLSTHPALDGPELTFLQAQIAHRRGQTALAHSLVHKSLTVLPGHPDFLAFAAEVGAPLPPAAQKIASSRL